MILATLLTMSFSFAQYFSVDVLENQEFSVESENVLFVGHATSFWDGGRTKEVTTNLVQVSRSYPLTTVGIVSDVMQEGILATNHYFVDKDMDVIVLSRAGQHSLTFPKVKNVFFLGGNLGRCLCEGIRDVARGLVTSPDFTEVNFYMIRDGIYDGYPAFSPMMLEKAVDFSKLFLGSSFNCPLQNWTDKKKQTMSGIKLSVYYDGEFLQDIDLEDKDDVPLDKIQKTIHVRFVESNAVEALFKDLQP